MRHYKAVCYIGNWDAVEIKFTLSNEEALPTVRLKLAIEKIESIADKKIGYHITLENNQELSKTGFMLMTYPKYSGPHKYLIGADNTLYEK